MSRFLVSCGGTGGHLSPGIALAEGLIARGHEATLLISHKKVDMRLSDKYPHLRFERVPGTVFSKSPGPFARFVASQTRGFFFCRRLVRSIQPDAIVGFGGFTSTGVVLAGWLRGVPVALHESNRVPGRATRVLRRLARRVYLPPGVQLERLPPAKLRHAGQPVRREIVRQPRATARVALGLDPNRKVLVVFGGSQGASPLNEWARTQRHLLAAEGIQVYCVTGLGKDREENVELNTKMGAPVRAVFVPFTDRVAELLSAADLVVARAGAGTIAELTRCETPSILVPFPQAADDHQRANAVFFAQEGGGLVVEQADIATLLPAVLKLISNEATLEVIRGNLHRMGLVDPLEFMLRDLEEMTGPRTAPPSTAQSSTA